jgi:hypothetical protein
VDTTPPPAVVVSKPVSNVTLSKGIGLAWTAGSDLNGIASYDGQYRRAPWNGAFSAWTGLFNARTSPSAVYTGAYGYDYCFRVRARDAAGNASNWSTQRCTAIPLDDRSLTVSSGWRRLTGAAFFAGTMTQSATVGSTLTRTGVRRGRVALVATRAPGFGTVSVFYNGTFIKKISLAYSTTQRRHVFLLPKFTPSYGKIAIKLVTAKRVQIDGLVTARI